MPGPYEQEMQLVRHPYYDTDSAGSQARFKVGPVGGN